MLKGIDVSQHQGKINWDVVKGNIDYAILRLGWTGNKSNHTVDTQFERNYSECKRLGIPVGVYIYNYCNSIEKAKGGANWTVEKLKGKTLELPVYLDMEDASIRGLGKTVLTNMCIEFNSIIEKAGFWAGVYANKDWFTNCLDKNVLGSRYTCWVAQYSSSCTLAIQNKDMWQYSSSGKVNGIAGRVDMNYLYRDLINEIGNQSKNATIQTSSKYLQGQAVEVHVKIKKTGAKEDRDLLVESDTVQNEEGSKQFWIHESVIKNDEIVARAIVCWVEGERCLVQVFDRQFWCKLSEVKAYE